MMVRADSICKSSREKDDWIEVKIDDIGINQNFKTQRNYQQNVDPNKLATPKMGSVSMFGLEIPISSEYPISSDPHCGSKARWLCTVGTVAGFFEGITWKQDHWMCQTHSGL